MSVQLTRRDKTLTWLARHAGLDYGRLSRLARGSVPVRLVDMAAINLALAEDSPPKG